MKTSEKFVIVSDMKEQLIAEGDISREEIETGFSWYKGEGIYFENNMPMILKGGGSFSYDVENFSIMSLEDLEDTGTRKNENESLQRI